MRPHLGEYLAVTRVVYIDTNIEYPAPQPALPYLHIRYRTALDLFWLQYSKEVIPYEHSFRVI
jgi:hypothetical protein